MNKEISRRFYKERREAYKNIDYLYDMDYFKKIFQIRLWNI